MVKVTKTLELAANEERRDVLSRLLEDNSVVIEPEGSREAEWHHNHLPKLEDFGVVTYESKESNIVIKRGPHFEKVAPLLTFLEEQY